VPKNYDRLAEYEDTGLTPSEVESIKQQNGALLKLKEADLIAALTRDKDEQAGKIMRMEDVLKSAREALKMLHPAMNPDEPCSIYEVWEAINEVLGGAKDV
jgi:hypothetical protein